MTNPTLNPEIILTLVRNLLQKQDVACELREAVANIRNECAYIMENETVDGKRQIPKRPLLLKEAECFEFPPDIAALIKDRHQEVRFFSWLALFRPAFFESADIASLFNTYARAEELFQPKDTSIPNASELAYLIDSQTGWRGLGEDFGRSYTTIKEDFLDEVGCRLRNYKGKRLIDLGCSHSDFADKARRYYSIDAFGLDVVFHDTFAVWSNTNKASRMKSALEIKKIDLSRRIAGSITNLPLDDNSVDCYVSHQSISYMPQNYYQRAFKEIVRTMKEGGEAFIFPVWPGIEDLLAGYGIKRSRIVSRFSNLQGRVYFKK